MVDFKKRGFIRGVNEFSSKENVEEVLKFIKGQRVAGELIVSLPGNGGISAITFKEKERPIEIKQ